MKLVEKPGDPGFLGSSELPLGNYIDRREVNGQLKYLDSGNRAPLPREWPRYYGYQFGAHDDLGQ
jgi:hypothetical protein